MALDEHGPSQCKFRAWLQNQISKCGMFDVLRHGVKPGPHCLDLFYGFQSAPNPPARRRFRRNRFTVDWKLS